MTEELHSLTLSELRETLKQRGVEIGLSSLSEMCKEGDIAAQLEARRQGNRLLFPPDAAKVLAAFLSEFRENPKLKNAARPDALRSFLNKPDTPASGDALAVTPRAPLTLSEFREKANMGQEIVHAMQQAGLLPAPDDRLLTIKEAQEQYGVSLAALHKISVREGGRRKVKQSAVLTYIARL